MVTNGSHPNTWKCLAISGRTHLEPLWVSHWNWARCCSSKATFGLSCWLQNNGRIVAASISIGGNFFFWFYLSPFCKATHEPTTKIHSKTLSFCWVRSDCGSSYCFVQQGVEDVWGGWCRHFHRQKRCLMPLQRFWVVFQDWQNRKVHVMPVWVKPWSHRETSSDFVFRSNGKWGSLSAGWHSLVLVCGMQRQWNCPVCLSLRKGISQGIGLGLFPMQR